MGNGSKPLKGNGRHEETRTPDLYRVKVMFCASMYSLVHPRTPRRMSYNLRQIKHLYCAMLVYTLVLIPG